jgi:hypothetical protein
MTRRRSIDHSRADDFCLPGVALRAERQALGLAEKKAPRCRFFFEQRAVRVREQHKRVNREEQNLLQ